MIKNYIYLLLIFLLSCGNPSVNPTKEETNIQIIPITSGNHTIYFGNKSKEIDVANKAELETLYTNMVSKKEVYDDSNYIIGRFDEYGNYYDKEDFSSIRTKIKGYAVYYFNYKPYLASIYYDTKTGLGMQMCYRLIIIDEKGRQNAFYGGGNDENKIPNENTFWTKYSFPFGYIKIN